MTSDQLWEETKSWNPGDWRLRNTCAWQNGVCKLINMRNNYFWLWNELVANFFTNIGPSWVGKIHNKSDRLHKLEQRDYYLNCSEWNTSGHCVIEQFHEQFLKWNLFPLGNTRVVWKVSDLTKIRDIFSEIFFYFSTLQGVRRRPPCNSTHFSQQCSHLYNPSK